ncbi:hypothetical protein AOCH_005033 [Aspergillus ochraceoroseus]|uniref:GPI-anchored cell wall organization protein Ecm33 n=1 Tax=Aspergillus ochraceoroseus TaxID=138278 RepID=A0A0F8WNW1_9EURO|nr:hypothetical protein AOCH_005033 [Aspergillus ochraceoroseus]
MAFVKYALPALAVAQAVLAAGGLTFNADCGSGSTIKIASQTDADGYETCKTLNGSVELDEHISGTLTLNTVERIKGSLSCSNGANITSLSAPSLATIDDAFDLEGLTSLTELSFPDLTSVGDINFQALPLLSALTFTTGVTEAGSVSIVNTGLNSLDGISLKTVGSFVITENTQLQTVNVNNLKNATNLINFAGNMESLDVSFPNLATGTNMTFRNVTSVSVPSLTTLTGQLGFWGNLFESFSAPNLTETGDLVFNDNAKLSNITMPVLKTVNGGFLITLNDDLDDINFPDLQTVTGAIDFSGEFNQASLPSLKNVRGGFNMQSTGNFSCTTFDKWKGTIIHGTYECKTTSHPTTSDGSSGSSTTTSSSNSSSTTTKSAAVLTAANLPSMGVAALFGLLVQYIL